MVTTGFDNDKYLKTQSEHIRERISKFGGKLYLEFGGKLYDDFHAARVLPGFKPDSKLQMLLKMKEQVEVVIVINSDHIEKNKLLDDIVMTLGGRVAEELIIKDISAGASNDISVVTARARKMVTEWGMSDKVGPVNYGGSDQIFIGRDMQTRANYSEAMATVIDEEIQSIIKNAHQKATELLTQNKSLLDVMARLLIERETIYQEEVDLIMEGKDVKTIMEIMDSKDHERTANPFKRYDNKPAEPTAPQSVDGANAPDASAPTAPSDPTQKSDSDGDKA